MAEKTLGMCFFSHNNGRTVTRLPQRFWSQVESMAGLPVTRARVGEKDLLEKIAAFWEMGSNLDLCFNSLIFSAQPLIFIKPVPDFADPPADI